MNNLKMFCLSLNSNHLNIIKELNYIPVGLGKDNFTKEWFSDSIGNNISFKNKYYGEYTFHYWLWKNYIDKIDNSWIGFCQYRKFWSKNNLNLLPKTFEEFRNLILTEIPKSYENFDVILGEESSIKKLKLMKFLKRGSRLFFKNPLPVFIQSKRNIKFHFDMWHGSYYLEKAIDLLEKEDKNDFKNFVNTKNSFNPHNMFICKSKNILKNYYSTVFPWLERCEKKFGFESLAGYGQTRIYGFLAERFMSYWFQKNTKYKTMPILFHEIGKKQI